MGINSTEVAYSFGQLGSGFSDEAVQVFPPAGKVIAVITNPVGGTIGFDKSE